VTHVTVGALTSDPLHRRRELYLKSYLDSFFAGYSEPLLALRAPSRADLYGGAPVHVYMQLDTWTTVERLA
jgi:hypothetical protein